MKAFNSRMAAGLALAVAGAAWAAGPAPFDMGRFQYETNCVACHGKSGKGDGPFVGRVDSRAGADITTLARRNKGVFPFARVCEVIDGRQEVMYHGTREMPIWGTDYLARAKQGDDVGDPDAFVNARIIALADYLYRLQSK